MRGLMRHTVAGRTRAMAALRPVCASEITSFTPCSPRLFKLRRKSVQKVSASGWVPDAGAGGDFGRTTGSEFLKLDCNREESEVAAVDAAAAVRTNLGTLRSLQIGT